MYFILSQFLQKHILFSLRRKKILREIWIFRYLKTTLTTQIQVTGVISIKYTVNSKNGNYRAPRHHKNYSSYCIFPSQLSCNVFMWYFLLKCLQCSTNTNSKGMFIFNNIRIRIFARAWYSPTSNIWVPRSKSDGSNIFIKPRVNWWRCDLKKTRHLGI